jgi:hypothetical protein
MKKSELQQLIKEEISKALKEAEDPIQTSFRQAITKDGDVKLDTTGKGNTMKSPLNRVKKIEYISPEFNEKVFNRLYKLNVYFNMGEKPKRFKSIEDFNKEFNTNLDTNLNRNSKGFDLAIKDIAPNIEVSFDTWPVD